MKHIIIQGIGVVERNFLQKRDLVSAFRKGLPKIDFTLVEQGVTNISLSEAKQIADFFAGRIMNPEQYANFYEFTQGNDARNYDFHTDLPELLTGSQGRASIGISGYVERDCIGEDDKYFPQPPSPFIRLLLS
jgi:hypothetical protein